jgi:hypothetical protein
MSGINTGILINAKPLSTERIKELEKQVLEKQETFAYLDENSDLCFSMPLGVDTIKDLAWHNAYELSAEENSFTKKAYKKTGLKTFSLDKVLYKSNINDSWGESERLKGDGQEFYTMAPSTLSFRSTAPLNELQDVQINGQTVDPSNYELEEGSTIVKLHYDYLSTLPTGKYEVAIVSDSKTVKGDFTVAAPELGEYGFYYDVPYITQLEDETAAIILTKQNSFNDTTLDITGLVLGVSNNTVATFGVYKIRDNVLVFSEDALEFFDAGYINPDGSIVFMDLTWTLGSDANILFDGEYIYAYSQNLEGYMVKRLCADGVVTKQLKHNLRGVPVVSIEERCFASSQLENIVLPESLIHIGDYAFCDCDSLTSIEIPNSVTSIGNSAFKDCTSLTSVTIGNSVTSIGNMAFKDCTSLTSVTIGNSVTSIGNMAFAYCTSLTSITVDANNTSYKSVDGNLYTKNGKTLIQYAIGKTATSFTIPSGVETIGNYAFKDCTSLTSIEIPNSVTSIGIYAFCDCDSLTSIEIPNSVTSICNYAFYNCSGLTSITIGNGVNHIGYEAFRGCSGLTSVAIPDSVTYIASYAFYDCPSLTSVTYNGTVAQWNAIYKTDMFSSATYVQCSDGQVAL